MTSHVPNKGQVLNDNQLETVARSLFETMDSESKGSLSKSECEEYFEFMKETVYHKPQYVHKSLLLPFEQRWKQLKRIVTEEYVPEGDDPNKLMKLVQERVEFDAIWEMVIAEAKEDGCLFIPFEETSKASLEAGKVPDFLEMQKKQSVSKIRILDDKLDENRL